MNCEPLLIVYIGDEDLKLEVSSEPCYLYTIGAGCLVGRKTLSLNDPDRLNRYAEEIRDNYVRWIQGFNKEFLENKMTWHGLSLFGISDISCKRTEFFQTFSCICNLRLIKQLVVDNKIERIRLVGADRSFETALLSLFPGADTSGTATNVRAVQCRLREWVSDILFGCLLINVGVVNYFCRVRSSVTSRGNAKQFFSIFPKLIDSQGQDKKYGKLCSSEDSFALSIITDGMHQRVSLLKYLKYRKALPSGGELIDDRLRLIDGLEYFRWMVIGARFLFLTGRRRYKFKGIDVTLYIMSEKRLSVRRIGRLLPFGHAFRRYCEKVREKKFVYYLHEYPIGRLLSFILSKVRPDIQRIGVQHGPASQRKLVYFLSKGEGAVEGPYLNNVPMPDQVWAEDESSRRIYRDAGYPDVKIMDSVSRLDYLSGITPKKRINQNLIAPGLHDGPQLLRVMLPIIEGETEKTFLIKPHPLANNGYLRQIKGQANCVLTSQPISELLGNVGKVYVTYSSIGPEAKQLGIPVTVVDIPGKINESPLVDGII